MDQIGEDQLVANAKTTIDQPKKKERLLSLDCLRGFDMMMISGAGGFIVLLENKTGIGWIDSLASQMHHADWNGFTFEDFIFPLFLFIAGISLVFSINKSIHRLGLTNRQIHLKAFRRMIILIILGIIYKNPPITFFDPGHIRVVSVLGRIGFATFIATLLYTHFNWKTRIAWFLGILLLYYAAMFLIPVPGYGAGDLSIEGNLAGWFDRTFLPGRLQNGIFDENGLLTQFPALCLTIMGTIAGDQLMSEKREYRKVLFLVAAGIIGIGLSLLWSLSFPINKHLWSSSFIMLTGGIAFLVFALFYWIIDVLKIQRWTFFFRVIGLNSLAIYMVYNFVDFNYTSHKLFSGLYAISPEPWHGVFQALGALLLVWVFLYFLYKKKIFFKV